MMQPESFDPFESMRELVAMHEAGHAVVALALGIDVVKVSVALELTECGSAFNSAVTCENLKPEDAVLGALFVLGGRVYEDLRVGLYNGDDEPIPYGRNDRGVSVDSGRDDITNLYRFADRLSGVNGARRTVGCLMARAVRILRRNLGAADAISTAVLANDPLGRDDLERLWAAENGQTEELEAYLAEALREIAGHPADRSRS